MTSSGLFGHDKFSATARVKQGGSFSCNAFTSYIYPTVEPIQSRRPDGWLENQHILTTYKPSHKNF
jgi:hypothetical protein